jgi:hypothetical protein
LEVPLLRWSSLILTLWWVYPWWLRRQRKKDRPYKPTLADLLRD